MSKFGLDLENDAPQPSKLNLADKLAVDSEPGLSTRQLMVRLFYTLSSSSTT